MFFYFSKLAQLFLWPLNISILLGIMLLMTASQKRTRAFAAMLLLVLIPPSLPVVARELMAPLENYYEIKPVGDYPTADAIVLLGGTTKASPDPSLPPEEIGGTRVITAARLYHAGRARKVLTSSGMGYLRSDGSWRTEAEDMADLLVELGVPREAILLERDSRNTEENAVFSLKLLNPEGVTSLLLVTSAHHIPRARAWFLKKGAGIEVHPVGAGRTVRVRSLRLGDFLPSAYALEQSTSALKEYLGFVATWR